MPQLPKDTCSSIGELWDKLISQLLPAKEILLLWHKVLMEYVERPDAMFVIRGGNNAKKNEYGRLRRGFLTRTNQGYSFFYTDNFHAAYFLKMAMDGYVPTVDELLKTYNTRQFPSRFGRDTEEERELMAMPRGKDPGFQTAGYKLAHIYNVGMGYWDNNRTLSLIRDIVDVYYPYGVRSDWKNVTDATGTHYERFLSVNPFSRRYLVAAFLRFVHPFNYFLAPKKVCSDLDVSENPLLISFVRNKMREMFGTAYDEFLSKIMPPAHGDVAPAADTPLQISYALNFSNENKSGVCSSSGVAIDKDKQIHVPGVDRKEMFRNWLLSNGYSRGTADNYSYNVRRCSNFMSENVEKYDFYRESDVKELNQKIAHLLKLQLFRDKDEEKHMQCSNALKRYGEFMRFMYSDEGMEVEGDVHVLSAASSENDAEKSLSSQSIKDGVIHTLITILESGIIEEQEIEKLLQKQFCREKFELKCFPLLSINPTFWNRNNLVKIGKKVYYLNNQLSERNIQLLKNWLSNYQEVADAQNHQDMSIGRFVRTVVRSLLESGVVDELEINRLLEKDYCSRVFGLRYAMLSEEPVYDNGTRTYVDPVIIRNQKYYITNDWYIRNRPLLDEWMARFSCNEV